MSSDNQSRSYLRQRVENLLNAANLAMLVGIGYVIFADPYKIGEKDKPNKDLPEEKPKLPEKNVIEPKADNKGDEQIKESETKEDKARETKKQQASLPGTELNLVEAFRAFVSEQKAGRVA